MPVVDQAPRDATAPPFSSIVRAEALAWLEANTADPKASVVTSLPDASELAIPTAAWRTWFIEAARRVLLWTPLETIFFQSDVRDGGAWIDKSYLVQRAAEEAGAQLVWHKIVCRRPPGTIAQGRASYSHMLCFARAPRETPKRPGPDVLADAGFMPWSRAMGEAACEVACRYLREETETKVVVDPFCGHGTVLAVAARHGFETLGVDTSARQVRAARRLVREAVG